MQKLCLILVLMLSVMLNGCGDKKDAVLSSSVKNSVEDKVSTFGNDKYDIAKATYTDQNIKVNYPQISNLSDSGKQKRINELIKTSALEVLDDYKDNLSSLNLNMDFEIKYKGADLLSIQYLGLGVVKESAYPVNVIQTANIDFAREKRLALSDVVSVNDSFIEKFKAARYISYGSDLNLESAGVIKDVLNGFSSNDLMESLKQRTAKFNFTKNSLGVSVEVAHAVGDHLEN